MKIICSVPDDPQSLPLEIAYKVARSEIVALTLQEEAEIDVGLLIAKIAEIKGELDRTRAIKKALSGAVKQIDKTDEDIETMEDSIKDILEEILELVQARNED
ncbi:MAG: hypothetical protein JRJ66_15860 [Deltaproteobacteria bacterium]|nr:hypothetical protein [Deltaproteobacteria bacterium]